MRSVSSKLKRILGRDRDLRLGPPLTCWRQMANPRPLAILFWVYLAQAVTGSVIGFTAPFLYYFGLL
jgi:hypothetical protein